MNFDKPLVVETDPSSFAVEVVMSRKDKDGKVQPIQLSSKTINDGEQNHTPNEKETSAFVVILKPFCQA